MSLAVDCRVITSMLVNKSTNKIVLRATVCDAALNYVRLPTMADGETPVTELCGMARNEEFPMSVSYFVLLQ